MKLSIIVPCYNEEKTIANVITRLLNLKLPDCDKEIIIIDDGSTDKSALFLAMINHPLIKNLKHENNLGKSAAIKTALPYISGDYTIIQDADLEYDPQDIINLLNQAITNDWSVIYGSRRLTNNSYNYLSYYLGANLITWLTNLLYGQKLTDVETCYKLIKTDLLKSLDICSANFLFENEITAKIARQGIKINEIAINYFPRKKADGKKLNYYHGLQALLAIFQYKFWPDKKPKNS